MTTAAARPARSKLADINVFLAQKRLAMIGTSRHPQDYTRVVMREFLARGYDVAPVNPNCEAVEDRPCAARVRDVAPAASAALVFVPPAQLGDVLRDCAVAGVRHIWIRHRIDDPSTANTVAALRAQGIGIIAGECPLMFLPNAAFFHRFHGMLTKITGRYPR